MYQSSALTALCLLTPCIASQNLSASTGPTPTSQPPDFAGEDTPYGIIPNGTNIPFAATGNVSVQNRIATWLYGYNGCGEIFCTYFERSSFLSYSGFWEIRRVLWFSQRKIAIFVPETILIDPLNNAILLTAKLNPDKAKQIIDEAYYDSWLIAKQTGVASGIDWNSAAALEFLGPPGHNKGQQAQIQNFLANVATMYYGSYGWTPLHHYIKVRCDDPEKMCSNPKDPCAPSVFPSCLLLCPYSPVEDHRRTRRHQRLLTQIIKTQMTNIP